MNETLWFFAAWSGGLLGGISVGWTAAQWVIRRRVQRRAEKLIRMCMEAWHVPSDVHFKETLDVPPARAANTGSCTLK